MKILEIHNEDEEHNFLQYIQINRPHYINNRSFWLGARKKGHTWYWVSNDEELVYGKWIYSMRPIFNDIILCIHGVFDEKPITIDERLCTEERQVICMKKTLDSINEISDHDDTTTKIESSKQISKLYPPYNHFK